MNYLTITFKHSVDSEGDTMFPVSVRLVHKDVRFVSPADDSVLIAGDLEFLPELLVLNQRDIRQALL
jgi:hypothetical protein